MDERQRTKTMITARFSKQKFFRSKFTTFIGDQTGAINLEVLDETEFFLFEASPRIEFVSCCKIWNGKWLRFLRNCHTLICIKKIWTHLLITPILEIVCPTFLQYFSWNLATSNFCFEPLFFNRIRLKFVLMKRSIGFFTGIFSDLSYFAVRRNFRDFRVNSNS